MIQLSLFFFNLFYLPIYFGSDGSSLPCRLFCSCREQGRVSSRRALASHCGDVTCWGPQALGLPGFPRCCGSWVRVHRFDCRDTWAQLPHGMWDLPGPGMEPTSLVSAGGYLSLSHQGGFDLTASLRGSTLLGRMSTPFLSRCASLPCFCLNKTASVCTFLFVVLCL